MPAEQFEGAPETGQAPAPIEKLTFEQALAELEAIVQKLERGQLDLDASIAAYERGTELRRHCADRLKAAQMRVEKLTLERDGDLRLQPLDAN